MKIPGILLALSCFRSVYANAPTIEMGEDVHIAPRCAAVVLAGGTAMGAGVAYALAPAALCSVGFCSVGVTSGSMAS